MAEYVLRQCCLISRTVKVDLKGQIENDKQTIHNCSINQPSEVDFEQLDNHKFKKVQLAIFQTDDNKKLLTLCRTQSGLCQWVHHFLVLTQKKTQGQRVKQK